MDSVVGFKSISASMSLFLQWVGDGDTDSLLLNIRADVIQDINFTSFTLPWPRARSWSEATNTQVGIYSHLNEFQLKLIPISNNITFKISAFNRETIYVSESSNISWEKTRCDFVCSTLYQHIVLDVAVVESEWLLQNTSV